jgi:hypothetical protein
MRARDPKEAGRRLEEFEKARDAARDLAVMPLWFYAVHAISVGIPFALFAFPPYGVVAGAVLLLLGQPAIVQWRRRLVGVATNPERTKAGKSSLGMYYFTVAVLLTLGVLAQELIPLPLVMLPTAGLILIASFFWLRALDRTVSPGRA